MVCLSVCQSVTLVSSCPSQGNHENFSQGLLAFTVKHSLCQVSFHTLWWCRTSEAFKRRLGVLGANVQAERMLKAFVSRGRELRLEDIKYHARGKEHDIESLTGISGRDTDAQVKAPLPCTSYRGHNQVCTCN